MISRGMVLLTWRKLCYPAAFGVFFLCECVLTVVVCKQHLSSLWVAESFLHRKLRIPWKCTVKEGLRAVRTLLCMLISRYFGGTNPVSRGLNE